MDDKSLISILSGVATRKAYAVAACSAGMLLRTSRKAVFNQKYLYSNKSAGLKATKLHSGL